MLHISLDADALAGSRFAVSPLMLAVAALHPDRQPESSPQRYPAQGDIEDLVRRRLHLLSSVRADIGGRIPEFMVPALSARTSDIDAELHRVATAPAHVVARQLAALTSRAPAHDDSPARRLPDLDAREFAQRIAQELEVFWHRLLVPVAASLLARAEGDIAGWARTIAVRGLGAALNALHPDIVYRDNRLILRTGDGTVASAAGRITLLPSPVAAPCMVSAGSWHAPDVYLVHPTRAGGPRAARRNAEAVHPLADVIGHSRFALLSALDSPRTTTELAERHRFGKSTISYHLSHLDRGGLVTRVRTGRHVYYQRTAKADRLLERAAPEPARV